jgi:hypothetical protein
MAGAFDAVAEVLTRQLMARMSEEVTERVGVLLMAKTIVLPGGDSVQQSAFERVTDYIRTGRWTAEETEDGYPRASGDVLMLGPGVIASTTVPAENTVINWRGENFIPQREPVGPDPALLGVVDPRVLDREPAPSSGEGWRGHRD